MKDGFDRVTSTDRTKRSDQLQDLLRSVVVHKQEASVMEKCWKLECAGNSFELHLGNHIASYQQINLSPILVAFFWRLNGEMSTNK